MMALESNYPSWVSVGARLVFESSVGVGVDVVVVVVLVVVVVVVVVSSGVVLGVHWWHLGVFWPSGNYL